MVERAFLNMALISQERFDQAETYAQVRERIIAGGGRQAHALGYGEWAANNIAADLGAFSSLDEPVNVLVLSEDWCPDCTDNLPILNRIAEKTGKLRLRILPRDENRDLADQFLWNGEYNKIPTIIFLDRDLNEIGHVIERPDSVTEMRNEKRTAFHAEHPEFGGYDANLREMPAELRDARLNAETDLKRETADAAVREVVAWLSAVVALTPVGD